MPEHDTCKHMFFSCTLTEEQKCMCELCNGSRGHINDVIPIIIIQRFILSPLNPLNNSKMNVE